MCKDDYKFRKTIIFQQDLTGTGTFVKRLDVPFTPTLMKVKNIAYRYTGKDATIEDSVTVVRFNTIGKKIGSFLDGQSTHPELTFQINTPIQGEHTFEVLDGLDDHDIGRDGVLVVVLEFLA